MIVGAAATLLVGGQASASGAAADEAQALAALDPWADALFSGDPEQVARVLAPEYQIVRSDGTGFGKDEYLTTLPKQAMRSQFRDIVATAHGEVMVIRYVIVTDQTIEGQAVEAVSPRLSVFRKDGDAWLIVSHASFAKLG
jgi:hypothetical protein